MRRSLLTALPLFALAAVALAADPKKENPTFLDAKEAGADFAVQGEYKGRLGLKDSKPFGAQVVAQGDGKFTIQFLPGGLPGDGWDAKTKIKATARTEDGKTTFSGSGWSGTIADGKITGKADSGIDVVLDRVVRKSTTEGAKPPEGAIVLFDGKNADEWQGGKLVEGDLLKMGITSKRKFKDCKLHVEFRLPFQPKARGQGRGNSGVYLQNRWEVQVLDSFGLEGKNNECGAIYSQTAPSVNMCYPPLSWQTYDIDFTAPKFDKDGKRTAPAVVTVLHNGVKVHDKLELTRGDTGNGYKEVDKADPIHIQDHGNPVYYRNIWVVEPK
jgi:hypothetical protein